MEIRPARPEELDAVGALSERAYRAGGHLTDDDGYAPVLRDAAGRAAAGPVLVAVDGGRLIGTVTLCPPGTGYAELAGAGEMEVRFLAVDPAAWGGGVGSALVAAADDHARAAGAAALVLFVLDANEPAHRMYRGLGFTRQPARDWEPVEGIRLEAYRRPVKAAAPGIGLGRPSRG